MVKSEGMTLGSSFREAICARVTVCRGKKINHLQKPHCSKNCSNTLSWVPSIPSGKSKSWKSTKAVYPIGLGRKFILQLFFHESSEFGLDNLTLVRMTGQGSTRQKPKSGWVAVELGAVHSCSFLWLQLRILPSWQVNPIKKSGFSKRKFLMQSQNKIHSEWMSKLTITKYQAPLNTCNLTVLISKQAVWWLQLIGNFLDSIIFYF